jgi:hypothetical protein
MARYAILVVALVVLGLITIWEHLRLLSVGYEVNDLRKRRSELEETARVLGRRIDAAATPARAAEMVRRLGIDLVPPEEDDEPAGLSPAPRTAATRRSDAEAAGGVSGPPVPVVSPQFAGRPAHASPPNVGARRDP